MRKLTIAVILAFCLTLLATPAVLAAGISVVSKTGDGVWVGNNWQVQMFPGETRATTIKLYNSSSHVLDVEVSISPEMQDGENVVFSVSDDAFTLAGRSYAEVILTVGADASATPGTYSVEFELKFEQAPSGGVGGAGDRTSPRISDILAFAITETTADISWQTNEKSDSQVEYWSSPSMLSELDEEMVIYHYVRLTGLVPSTAYYYKTMSSDRAGNLAVSDVRTFTTKGKVPVAAFVASNLSISPREVDIGEMVTIGVVVTNTGNAAGSYEVTLKINGVVEATKDVMLGAGASEMVTFATVTDVAGSYSVEIDGLRGSFTVREKPAPPVPEEVPLTPTPIPEEPFDWPLVGGIIVAGVIAGLVIYFWVSRRLESND